MVRVFSPGGFEEDTRSSGAVRCSVLGTLFITEESLEINVTDVSECDGADGDC